MYKRYIRSRCKYLGLKLNHPSFLKQEMYKKKNTIDANDDVREIGEMILKR